MKKIKTPTKSNPSTPSKKGKTKPSLHALETIPDESPLSPAQISLNERLKSLENVPATPLRARWLSMLQEIPQASKLSCTSQFNDLMTEKTISEAPPIERSNTSNTTRLIDNDSLESITEPISPSASSLNEHNESSYPSATNFINRIIHNEVIHGDKISETQTWSNQDVLVLNTQPEDYEVLNDSTTTEQIIPEIQLNPISENHAVEIASIPIQPTSTSTVNRKPSFPIKSSVTNGTFQLFVPLTDFPLCPMEDFNDLYFEQTFTKCLNKNKKPHQA